MFDMCLIVVLDPNGNISAKRHAVESRAAPRFEVKLWFIERFEVCLSDVLQGRQRAGARTLARTSRGTTRPARLLILADALRLSPARSQDNKLP
jgi:hypothetical protein